PRRAIDRPGNDVLHILIAPYFFAIDHIIGDDDAIRGIDQLVANRRVLKTWATGVAPPSLRAIVKVKRQQVVIRPFAYGKKEGVAKDVETGDRGLIDDHAPDEIGRVKVGICPQRAILVGDENL